MSDYQQFKQVPSYEMAVWADGKVVNAPDAIKWSGKEVPPPVGAKIIVTMNNLGPAIVTGYFIECGWLGLLCRLEAPPAWHIKQNKGDRNGHIFGVEFEIA